jgi:hypothetical protein
MEFMVLFTLFLVVAGIALYASIDRTRDITDAKIGVEASSLVSRITTTVNSVYLQGDGFSTSMVLPYEILSLGYNASFQSNQLLLTAAGKLYTGYVLTGNVTGNLTAGTNIIRNSGGWVIINE